MDQRALLGSFLILREPWRLHGSELPEAFTQRLLLFLREFWRAGGSDLSEAPRQRLQLIHGKPQKDPELTEALGQRRQLIIGKAQSL